MKSKNPLSFGSSPVLLLAVGFLAGAVVVGSVGAIATGAGWLTWRESVTSSNVVHNVTVSYMYETNPGSASGSKDLSVESIQFHPGYVVITQASGHGSLFAVDRLRNFQFAPTKSDSF
jgi:hypothetical protein